MRRTTRSRPAGAARGPGVPLPLALALGAAALVLAVAPPPAAATELALAVEGAALTGSPLHLAITVADPPAAGPLTVVVRGEGRELGRFRLAAGEHDVVVDEPGLAAGRHRLAAEVEPAAGETGPPARAEVEVRVVPGWLAVVPPLVAIGLALAFKDVLVSLFLGVFGGALILHHWNPLTAFARTVDRYVVGALADPGHVKIVVFTLLLGGMVGVISKSGGTRGIVARIAPFATTARRGQLAAWTLGVLIFFDDYANTLIVGSTMRPVTDRLRVSREKLAYIVDSTAAPVASLFPISTWIGFELGLIAAALTSLGLQFNPYAVFIASLPYRFYPILALVLGFTIAFACRDFGPMLEAELRAGRSGKLIADGDIALADYASAALEPPDGVPHRALNAVLPISTVVALTVAGLYASGTGALAAEGLGRADFPGLSTWLREVFSRSDSSNALMWASAAGVTVALALPLATRLLKMREAMGAMVEGFKSMLLALIVLVLAWSIGAVCGDLHTADYVVALAKGALSPHWLPVLVFVISAVVSFATGTSWGTMGILMPLVIPISHGLSLAHGHPVESPAYYTFLLGTVSSVLAGSVWGDHCSPISDTTILSSIASGSDHIAHVRTQLPYALGVGVLGMVLGDIPTAYGLSPWISLAVGAAVIVAGVRWLGKRSDGRGTPAGE
jgi:Na+/H+ antiporter NhaC